MSLPARRTAGSRSMIVEVVSASAWRFRNQIPMAKCYVALTLEGVRKHFVQDIPADEADIVFATQEPLAVKCFGDKITEAAWRSELSWYVVCSSR